MLRSAELKQKSTKALEDAKALFHRVSEIEKRAMTSEENSQWSRYMADCEQFRQEATQQEKFERASLQAADRANGGSGHIGDHADGPNAGTGAGPRRYSAGIALRDRDGKETRALAPNESVVEYLRARGDIREEHEGVTFGDLLRSMITGPRNEYERRALGEASDSTGGVTVPVDLMASFVDKLRPRSRVIEAGAKTVLLNTEKTSVARVTTDPTVAWRSENGDVAQSDAAFDKITFSANSLACLCPVSRELIDDSINASDILTTALSAAIGNELDRAALLGSGSAPEPKGIKSYTSGVGAITMGATAGATFTNYNPFLDALELIQAANADDSALAVILNPTTLNLLSKLQDTTHQPMRIPPALQNLRWLTTTKLPTNETYGTSSGICSSAVMGDFSQLWIGMRMEARIEVLREVFASKYQLGFLVSLRADVQIAHLESFAKITGITLT